MMSSFATAVISSTTLHFSLAQAMNSKAHFTVFIGLPAAPIMHMAMFGKHSDAHPASFVARHIPNLTKHLALPMGPCASAMHCLLSSRHALMTSMIPLSVSRRSADSIARAKGSKASCSLEQEIFAQATNWTPQANILPQLPEAANMHTAVLGRQGPAQGARSLPMHAAYPK